MSFSQETKKELSQINNLAKKELIKYELMGYLITCNSSVVNKKNIRYSTENEYNINRFAKLLSNLKIDYSIKIEGKWYIINFKIEEDEFIKIEQDEIQINYITVNSEEEKKSLIRGSFLGSGSINNPDNKYHLEIRFSGEKKALFVKNILREFGINFKILKLKEKYSIYVKEGEEISNFLALIGANKSVLKFEDIRVQREMRGKVNRLVNCKSANLNKTINASVEQIDAIKKIQNKKKFEQLDDSLKEIAILRLANPDLSLIELGKMLEKPLGKSGVNYRLKKIIEIANEI